MNQITREQFMALLKEQRIGRRLSRELRYKPEDIDNWSSLDMLAVGTRSGGEGLILIQLESCYILPYELSVGLTDKLSGRAKPITCDFCFTWQRGTKAGRITFKRISDGHSFTYLRCADLGCSLHVRDMTPEASLSRTQLHEDMDNERRIKRLHQKLTTIINTLGLSAVTLPQQPL